MKENFITSGSGITDYTVFIYCTNLQPLTRLILVCPFHEYEGGSESSVIGVVTLLIDMIDCCIIPWLKGLHFSFIMMPK